MNNTNAYSHLTLEERRIILKGITNGSTKTAIAQTIGKDKSTIGKEIKAHRVLVKKCPLPLECSAYKKCLFDRQCSPDCPDYLPFRCSRATGFDMSGASDFMLLDRKVVGAILEYGERGSFFRALAQFVGFRTAEVRYEVAARKNGKGTWTLKKLIKYAVSNLASFTTAPLLAGLFFGGICLLAGAVLLILRAAGIPLGSFSAAVSVMIIISGLVLICLGISGYYLSKIYDEIKHRPRYHIAAKVNERKDNNER